MVVLRNQLSFQNILFKTHRVVGVRNGPLEIIKFKPLLKQVLSFPIFTYPY